MISTNAGGTEAFRFGTMRHRVLGLEAIYDGLHEIGGSFSAEHGIGNQKTSSLKKYSDQQKYKIMQLIKESIDPNNIMNPGKIFLT